MICVTYIFSLSLIIYPELLSEVDFMKQGINIF